MDKDKHQDHSILPRHTCGNRLSKLYARVYQPDKPYYKFKRTGWYWCEQCQCIVKVQFENYTPTALPQYMMEYADE